MIKRLSNLLTRKPKLILVTALILAVVSLFGYLATPINYDILTYLPDDLPSTQGEQLLEDPFGMAATTMLIVEGMPAGYSEDLIRDIRQVPGVSQAVSLSDVVGVQIPVDLLPAEITQQLYRDDSVMMIVQYSHPAASEETMAAIDQVRKLCNKKCFLAGFSVVIKDTRDLVARELPLFILFAVLFCMAAMMLTLESTLLPIAFLSCIGLAILYNMGTNILLGEISYITKAIAAILQLGVTMDYSIFLYRRYAEERENYEDRRDAMAVAVEAAFGALSGSSLTTIAGFLALCFMQLSLGRDIGLVMAKGVALGVLTVIFVLPSFLLIFDRWIQKFNHRTILPNMSRLSDFVVRHRKAFLVLFLVILIPAYYGQSHTDMYYKLDKSLPGYLPSIQANEYMKETFDMTGSHFILMSDDVKATDMNVIEDRIRKLDGVTSLISYHALLGEGLPEFFIPEEVRSMLKQDGYQMLMVNSDFETASPEVSDQLNQIENIIKPYDPDVMITGEPALTDDLIDIAAVDFRVTNLISLLAVFVIIMISFRSVTVPAVLVATIELAIFINQGIPYFTGSEIAFVTPTIIGCIQMGATIDYAILMTTRFREELQKGLDRFEAIKVAATTSAPSIITSALVFFCACSGVTIVADIDMIRSICLMLARGAIISGCVCLFIMPAVLCVFEPLFQKTSLNWRTPRGTRLNPEERA